MEGLPIDFHSSTRALAESAADFKCRFRFSLADAFADRAGHGRKAELVTADPELKPLDQDSKSTGLR
jgi:hypothetical protein